MVVGRNGGVAKQLAISVEGVSFRFTNALDIDQCWTKTIFLCVKTELLVDFEPKLK